MKIKTLKTVFGHPLNKNRKVNAFWGLLKRGLLIRLHKNALIYPFINNTFLVVDKGMTSAELQIYTGLYDFEEMLLMLHYLTENENFIDVGANVGVYTVLASGLNNSKSYSFEPIPSTFNSLKRNVIFNNLLDKVTLFNNGVGHKKDQLFFTNNLDAVNHIIQDETLNSEKVQIDTLDNFLGENPAHFLKIDVEGFEENVLKGATKTLKNPALKIILIETNGLTSNYDSSDNNINQILIENGFITCNYDPLKRKLSKTDSIKDTNSIYCRDIEFINERVKLGQKIRVFETEY